MKNVSNKKTWNSGMTQAHVGPPPAPLNKTNNYHKSEKYYVKIKLRRDPTSSTSDLYELKTALFDNGEPEDFCCSCKTST